MRKLLTVVLSIAVTTAAAQWTDTQNKFLDSLHMPVSTATWVQKNPIVLTSYPDGGYFVIWEDLRTEATTKTDIYAQKYDAAGNRLWAEDGIPIGNTANNEHYTFSSNQDYRNRSFVATDSAGGFYICYSDDSVTNYVYERVMVQHMRPNGTKVFPTGNIMARSGAANLQMASQMIPDGNKGFFLAYKTITGNDYINVHCYRDEAGTLVYYGGGRMNENGVQTSVVAICGIKTDVVYPGTNVGDYAIWSDLEGGCNVVMDMNGNIGGQGRMLTYNRLWRAKTNAASKTYFRNTSGSACPRTKEYFKGNVYTMYQLKTDYQSVFCQDLQGNAYAYTNYRLISNGYLVIDNAGYDYGYPKGVTIATPGNINVTLMAASVRYLIGNSVSAAILKGYTYRDEKFDSIPYQHTSYSNPDFGYNTTVPLKVNELNNFRDSLLATSVYSFDFSLAGGGSNIYAVGILNGIVGRDMKLQRLTVSRKTADSFAIEYNTNILKDPERNGALILKDISTGFGGSDLFFDLPMIKVSNRGNAVFYTRDYYRAVRLSPIDGAELQWGAMGKPLGSGSINASLYAPEQPVMAFDSTGSSGIMVWRDSRYRPGFSTYDDLYMTHVVKLDQFNYTPPIHTVSLLPNPYGPTAANPNVFSGRSNRYSTIEVKTAANNPILTPIADIQDYENMGSVRAGIYQHSAAIRKYNGEPYLNRNYTFLTENSVAGKEMTLMLYFTQKEFDVLKAADPIIADPGFLSVVRQDNTTNNTPTAYTSVSGEEIITPNLWDSVDGGYRLWITSHGLGDFYIKKMGTVNLCSGTSTSFTSNITGSTYQWQVSVDGGAYSNLSSSANYSGVNAITLQINNVPSSYSSNRYRCVVNGTKVGNAFYLQVGNTWTGAVSSAWENVGNWSCGKVPDANTDVIINSGTVTVNSNVTCRSLKVSPGASVTVTTGFKITVTN